MKLEQNELNKIYGGGSIFTAAFFSALTRGYNALVTSGRYVGSSIRRLLSGNLC